MLHRCCRDVRRLAAGTRWCGCCPSPDDGRTVEPKPWNPCRPADIKHAPPFEAVQREAAALLQGRVIVGHSISNDLKASPSLHLPLGTDWTPAA